MTTELKPCPFCGEPATHANTSRGWKIECSQRWGQCTMNARTHYQPTKFQAIDAWNRRADEAPPEQSAPDHKRRIADYAADIARELKFYRRARGE